MNSGVLPKIHHVQFAAKNVEAVEYIFARGNNEVHRHAGIKVGADGHALVSDSYTAGVLANALYIKVKPIPGHSIELFNLELEACMEPCKFI